jgi:hypothetical protein
MTPTITNLHNVPDALVRAVQNDPYDAGKSDISVTKLIDAPQRRVLTRQHEKEISVDVSERIWALTGQALHHILERAESNELVEQRLFATVDGWVLSGQFDRLHLGTKTLQDYKFTTTYKAEGDDNWIRQLNILRWLAHQNEYDVERLEIVAIFRDWRRGSAERDPNYPQQAIKVIDIPVWPLDETYEYIRERIAVHQAAQKGTFIPCTDEERWYQGTKYALKKPGGKRALKVVEDTDPAVVEALIQEAAEKQYEVDIRVGEYRRCASYCEVSAWCPQWDKAKQLQPPAEEADDATS